MARLHRPGLVEVFDVGEEEGVSCFTMRIVDGVTLSRVIEAGPLSALEAARELGVSTAP